MTWMIHAIYAGYLLLLFLSVVSPLLQRPLVDYGMLAIAVKLELVEGAVIFYRYGNGPAVLQSTSEVVTTPAACRPLSPPKNRRGVRYFNLK